MSFICYLKDKLYSIILFFVTFGIFLLLFFAFKIDVSLMIVVCFLFLLFYVLLLGIDYFRKKKFYTELLFNIQHLDKAYLVLETLSKPSFYEGELLFEALYEIDKSMGENVQLFKEQMIGFKEFVELWIHEVKLPISSLVLLAHNHKDSIDKKVMFQIKKIEDYVEEILYYVRSENAHKDYLINQVSLDKVIGNVALRNKDDFLAEKVDFIASSSGIKVFTDSKWLEFILNQIIHNSLKYQRDDVSSYIKILVDDFSDKVVVTIEDNGIGIVSSDLPRVFEKSFTGFNGREFSKSTGMGLFIVKNLCEKLGHSIAIDSKRGEYTKVFITFYKDRYYEVV